MADSNTLYIPMGLKGKNELWDDFGKSETIKVLIFNTNTGAKDDYFLQSKVLDSIEDGSDLSSIDALVVPKYKIAIVDGTPPHGRVLNTNARSIVIAYFVKNIKTDFTYLGNKIA